MQTKKEPLDLDTYFDAFLARYFKWQKYLFDKDFQIAQNKEAFINSNIVRFRKQYIFYIADKYLNDMVTIFHEKLNLKRPKQEMVDAIQLKRKYWENQRYYGMEYQQPYEPVCDFVLENRDEKVVKKLVKYAGIVLFKAVVLDAELKKLKPSPLENIVDKGIKVKKIIQSFKWKGKKNPEDQLAALYKWLIAQEFILKKETSLNIFKDVFRGVEIEQAIIWHGELGELTYLLDELAKHFLVLPKDIETIIKSKEPSIANRKAVSNWLNPKLISCFLDNKGIPFEKEKIKSAKNFYQNKKAGIKKPGKGQEIDKLIRDLVKIR